MWSRALGHEREHVGHEHGSIECEVESLGQLSLRP